MIVHVVMSFLLGVIFRHMLLSTKVNAEPEEQRTGGMSELTSFFELQAGALPNLTYN